MIALLFSSAHKSIVQILLKFGYFSFNILYFDICVFHWSSIGDHLGKLKYNVLSSGVKIAILVDHAR